MIKTTSLAKIISACLIGFIGVSTSQAAVSAGSGNREITHLSATEEEKGRVTVSLNSNGPIQYTAFKLSKPPKLIIDLSDMRPGAAVSPIELNKGIVKSIRPMYFDESRVFRLEMELTELPDYHIERNKGNSLTIRLARAGNLPAMETEAVSNDFPESIEESPVAEEAGGGSSNAENAQAQEGGANQEAMQEMAQKEEEDPCTPILAGVKEKITLDFQDADLINTLRLIAEVSGFNMIFASGIEGKLNMRLVEVPWNEAFKIILANNRLGRECFGDNVVRVAPLNSISEENTARVSIIESNRNAKDAVELDQPMETEVVKINNIDPSNFKTLIDDILKDMLSGAKHGSQNSQVIGDIRTRSIIITDVRPTVDHMVKVLKILDAEVIDPEEELSKHGEATLEEQKESFPTIPLPIVEYIQQNDAKLYADLEYYEELFSDKARVGKMSPSDQTAAINEYKEVINQIIRAGNSIQTSALQGPFESLRWVGSLLKKSGRVALVETEDNKGHVVKIGALVGPNYGKVDSITEKNVIVLESVRDFEGNIFSKKVKISYQVAETN